MTDLAVLDVRLYGQPIGTITNVPGDRNLFAFTEAYLGDPDRALLSLAFKDQLGGLLTQHAPTQARLLPFFANLLPEDRLRGYLAQRAGVNPAREFHLLAALGEDLPGAVSVVPAAAWPLRSPGRSAEEPSAAPDVALRFSLAGIQLRFSALSAPKGWLTIPASGRGGNWIVKLPSARFAGVPENEFAMMQLARDIGIEVPETRLVPLDAIGGLPDDLGPLDGPALAVRRFDRGPQGPVHMEDFAQVFGVYPEAKYQQDSAAAIARVIGAEAGLDEAAAFIRRLTFMALTGNADMHLKNWSLIYPARERARLAPAYDLVATTAYLPDANAALKFGRTRRFDGFGLDELAWIAAKAHLPCGLVQQTARETVQRFRDLWPGAQQSLAMAPAIIAAIERQLAGVPIAREA